MAPQMLCDEVVAALAALLGGAGMTTEGGWLGAWVHPVKSKVRNELVGVLSGLSSPAMAPALLCDEGVLPAVLAALPNGAGMTTDGGWPGACVQAVMLKVSGATPLLLLPAVFTPPQRSVLKLVLKVPRFEKLRSTSLSKPASGRVLPARLRQGLRPQACCCSRAHARTRAQHRCSSSGAPAVAGRDGPAEVVVVE